MPKLQIRTHHACWVVPESVEIIKLLIAQQRLCAADLFFKSCEECQCFARRLALLALKDEVNQQAPSVIAELSRCLIEQSTNTQYGVKEL